MKYVLLIYDPPGGNVDPTMLAQHAAFAENAGRRGLLVDGAELSAPSVATTITRVAGETIITDGPFVETKEHLGGFYIINSADLDAALDVARLVPLPDGGAVEVRPLVER